MRACVRFSSRRFPEVALRAQAATSSDFFVFFSNVLHFLPFPGYVHQVKSLASHPRAREKKGKRNAKKKTPSNRGLRKRPYEEKDGSPTIVDLVDHPFVG